MVCSSGPTAILSALSTTSLEVEVTPIFHHKLGFVKMAPTWSKEDLKLSISGILRGHLNWWPEVCVLKPAKSFQRKINSGLKESHRKSLTTCKRCLRCSRHRYMEWELFSPSQPLEPGCALSNPRHLLFQRLDTLNFFPSLYAKPTQLLFHYIVSLTFIKI